jgi:hypothetical protein
MSLSANSIEAPLAPEELARRWQALCADPTFEDIPGKIELTEWGEILMSPVGKSHGIAAARIVEAGKALGGHTMVEVGVATGRAFARPTSLVLRRVSGRASGGNASIPSARTVS